MNVCIAGVNPAFHPWTPAYGTVFNTRYAFDCETAQIDLERPG